MANEILYTKAGLPKSLLFILFGAGFEHTSAEDLAAKVDAYYPNVSDINRIVNSYIYNYVTDNEFFN